MVFQSYALYPSMSVRENIAFGLEMRKVAKTERDQEVERVAKMLQIEHLLDRKPAQLSGGQRQRVAMGWALARKPKIYLFDEPLSNLDAKLRVEMRTEIKKLHQRLGTTIVYVTHDQIEAMTLADRIAVMKDGVVLQLDSPQNIYDNPINMFVAGLMGSPAMNFIKAPLVKLDQGYGVSLTNQAGDTYALPLPQAKQASAPKPAGAPAAAAPQGQVSFDEVAVSQMRKTIARRLAESKFTAPHFYLTMSIDMDKAVESRGKINEVAPAKISFNDMVLKACALALKQHPKVNSSWLGDKIRFNHHVNIGVAVAVEEGLLVPVIRFADTKSLSQIAVEVKEYAQKAKDKKLQPSDWEGNTFTISNLGMFGIDEFTAIINPPDACILAIGSIQQVPVVKDGVVKPGNIMKVTLSCDHRVVDGASGAAFLQTLKSFLEEPLRMLV